MSSQQARYELSPNVTWRKSVVGGETAYVYSNDLTGAYFATDAATHQFLLQLRQARPLQTAIAESRAETARILKTIPALIEAGLIASLDVDAKSTNAPTSQSPKKKPLEARLIFTRLELGEIGWLHEAFPWLARFLFARLGLACFAIAILVAVNGIAKNADTLNLNFTQVAHLSPETMVTLTMTFLLLKMLHEIGHAIATAHFLQVECRRVPLVRWGIAFFFFIPLPFTNTTASWDLQSKWRRAAIGAAGIYVEIWIAAIAAIIWAAIGEGELQIFLFNIMLVAGVSTLLFNLNPLVRLDGYYILTDICDLPNLSTRAARVARNVGHRLLGIDVRLGKHAAALFGYWLASLAYRALTIGFIALASLMLHPALGVVVVAVGGLVLFVRPAVTTVQAAQAAEAAQAATPDKPGRITWRIAAIAGLLIGVPFIPIDGALVLEGHVVADDKAFVYPSVAGQVGRIVDARNMPAGAGVVSLFNPELSMMSDIARAELGMARLAVRAARMDQPDRIPTLLGQVRAAEAKLADAERRIRALNIVLPAAKFWQPARSVTANGSWVVPTSKQHLGTTVGKDRFRLVARLEHDRAESTISEIQSLSGLLRVPGLHEPPVAVRVQSVQPIANASNTGAARPSTRTAQTEPSGFNITLELVGDHLPQRALRDGKRIVVRLSKPSRPVWQYLQVELQRLLQRRFRMA
ncbi:MAG: hypothetical protein AAGC70_20300 [Pseudomonadota bacterium]